MTDINWHDRLKNTPLSVRNLINGAFSAPQGDKLIEKYAPHDGSLLYSFGEGRAAEVDLAVASARESFEDGRWRNKLVGERQAVLNKLADLIAENREQLGLYEALDVGKTITAGLYDDVERTIGQLRGAAAGLDNLLMPSGVRGNDMGYQYRKPIGVVGAIVGWNFPLTLAASKLAPALAMGNSLVIKPSEFTSLSAIRLAELALEAGVPPGVVNVVHGLGTTVGAALAGHNDVDMITFTGSSATGKQIMIAAGQSNMKRVHLECGGKSPYLVFDDCPEDLDWMAQEIVGAAFPNQGALCISSTRLLVQEGIKDRLMEKVLAETAKITPQDPLLADTTFGAIMNEAHMNKVLAYVERGKREGAEHLYGGERVHQETGGFYLTPAVFDQVKANDAIAQEETFGPLLSIFTFKTEEEAVALANNTTFGLASYIATTNLARGHRVSQGLNTGMVIVTGNSADASDFVNLGNDPQRQSGMGFEGGRGGLEAYSVVSAIHVII